MGVSLIRAVFRDASEQSPIRAQRRTTDAFCRMLARALVEQRAEVVRALRPMMERFPKPGADADWMAHRALMGMSPSLDAISASAGGCGGGALCEGRGV